MPSASGGRVRLVVLYGGRSAEHDVSCVSAANVVAAVDPERYDLRMVGITTTGEWVDATAAVLDAGTGPRSLPAPDSVLSTSAALPAGPAALIDPSASVETVVLPLLHGPMGEDGTLQGLLELAGVAYCGPGVAGSAVAMDKGLAKAALTAAGLPQSPYLYVPETRFGPTLAGEVESALGWPVFVKPANMGSSIGITKVSDASALTSALELATRYDTAVVVEAAVPSARELEIGVLGWPTLRVSVPGEIKASHEFYDYEDKYVDGIADLEIPAQLPGGVADQMARLAVAACEAMRIDSMARVDFFYTASGHLLINEVNTIPGFTPISMYPQMWAATGIPYADLVDALVDQARRRHARRQRFETRH
jgi:D-alanine-D-alanine ligase